ncbi:hypothetical protein JRQ81_016340 [Phrynocephalus forsythii]|uniref:RNA-splicing ligase RtcB homolog n=2 Tax=Sauria TaxID=32561 RepID=A0A9Q0XYY5_9SAUR|nr:hypothetical protein JRQ81_016340 [Phrynocephalus forsythii]
MNVWGSLVFFGLFVLCLDANPGIQVKITQKGLDFGTQFGLQFLKQRLKEEILEDWHGQNTSGFTGLNYRIFKIRIETVEFPSASASLIPGKGINLLIKEASATLTADWKLKSWIFRSSGRMAVFISGVSVTAVATISQDEIGRPILLLESCQGSVRYIDIQLDESSRWMYKVFANFLERPLRNSLSLNLCPTIDSEIQRINMELRQHQVRTHIDAFAVIDYSLINSPSIFKTFINLYFKGTIYPAANETEPPFKPNPFMLPDGVDSMLYIGVSEYFFQTASLAYYTSGAFDASVAEQLSAYFMLTTETFARIIPMITTRYRNSLPVMINLTATAAPVIKLHSGSFILVLAGSVDVLAVQPDSTIQSMFTLNVTAKTHVSLTLFEKNLVPALCLDSFNLSLAHSNIGFFKVSLLKNFVSFVLKNGIIPAANVMESTDMDIGQWVRATPSAVINMDKEFETPLCFVAEGPMKTWRRFNSKRFSNANLMPGKRERGWFLGCERESSGKDRVPLGVAAAMSRSYNDELQYLDKIDKNCWRIKKGFVPNMNVEGVFYVNDPLEKLMFEELRNACRGGGAGGFLPAMKQIGNVAALPGIVHRSIGLPDVHSGYGFAIGNMAAFDMNDPEAVVSPGGVGFDINCGVRLLRTNLDESDVQPVKEQLAQSMFDHIPVGVGSKGVIPMNAKDLEEALEMGVDWSLREGYAWAEDKEHCEEYGRMLQADPNKVSARAKKRGLPQLGTLGAGNHYAEIQIVDDIYNDYAARKMGIDHKGQVCVMIHSGSRGLGHQVATDALVAMEKAMKRDKIIVNDRQLACARIASQEGQDYLKGMAAAGNYAWVNRSSMTFLTRQAFAKVFNTTPDDLDMHVIYDVSHNIAKVEQHVVDGKERTLLVHRKGSTRAFPPHHPLIAVDYQLTGQPVLIGGTMGTCSYVLTGTEQGMTETFGTTCHGAGRALSRAKSRRNLDFQDVLDKLADMGIAIRVASPKLVMEEAPESYKNVTDVVNTCHAAGISKKAIKLRPIAVIKG